MNDLDKQLIFACSYPNTNVDKVLKLIETGANINIKDADGMTPLMHVVKNRYEWPPDRDDHYIDELNTDLFFLVNGCDTMTLPSK